MLTTEQILKNKEIYLELAKKYGIANENLFTELGDDLFSSPASTMTSLHNAFPGGLVDHLIKVGTYAIKINETLPEQLKIQKSKVVKVALLSEIGKVGQYKVCESECHRKNQGKMYEFVDDNISLTVGAKSIYKILSSGTKLTPDEYQAILTFDKDINDEKNKSLKWHAETLTIILRQAVELAILEEKSIYN
jgi:hypothetical protein